jgi:hypothetical protein
MEKLLLLDESFFMGMMKMLGTIHKATKPQIQSRTISS